MPIHGYGSTETAGAVTLSVERDEWPIDNLPALAAAKARQGVPYPTLTAFRVAKLDGVESVPSDGETIGEVIVRGASVMSGYRGPATETDGTGWRRTGDLAVRFPDGSIQIRDRASDIIISGGESISSVELEHVLATHPAVAEVAVVAKPHPRWQETPCAFVVSLLESEPTEGELISWTRERLAHFKAPSSIVFIEALPRNATGKVRKDLLREQVRTNMTGEHPSR